MTENFTFHGPTTFINRPIDTIIKDFQNNHDAVPNQEHLATLLREVLTSTMADPDKKEAERTVNEIAKDLAAPSDHIAAKDKLAKLRTVLIGAAGATQPALEIINKILSLLGH